MIEFQVENGRGEGGSISLAEINDQLAKAGYNPQGMTANGMILTLADDQGTYEVKTEDVLKQLGWNVLDMRPENADYDAVDAGWRAAIELLPNDDTRRAYIEGQLKRLGHEDPHVIGRGDSWYGFNPQTNQWVALTNAPGFDKSDVAGLATGVPRFAGALAGGAAAGLAGIETGPGAIATAALGAGAGGAYGDTLTRAAMAAYDPQYRAVAEENLGEMGKDVALNAGVDALTGGFGQGATMAARSAKPLLRGVGNALSTGAASTAARGVGAAAEAGGAATAGTARFLGGMSKAEIAAGEKAAAEAGGASELAHMFTGPGARTDMTAGMFIPGAMEAQTAAVGLQAPSILTRSLIDMAERGGGSSILKDLFPAGAKALENTAARLSRTSGKFGRPERLAEEMAQRLGSPPTPRGNPLAMRDVYGNLGESLGSRGGTSARKAAYDQVMAGNAGGAKLPHSDLLRMAEEAGAAAEAPHAARGARWRTTGERFGSALDTAERLGDKLYTGTREATRLGLRGVGLAGRGLQHGGRALKLAGRVAQPVENRALMRYGAEEALGPDYERLDPWKRRAAPSTMDTYLATAE